MKAYPSAEGNPDEACLKREHFATVSTPFLEVAVPKLANCEIHRNKEREMKMSIFVIGENEAQQRTVSKLFELAGFRTMTPDSSRSLIHALQSAKPDVVVIAVETTVAPAVGLCERIRNFTQIPIIVSPLYLDDTDESSVLLAGADDFVARNRDHSILVTRTRALIHRTFMRNQEQVKLLEHAGIEVNIENRIVKIQGRELSVTKTEFDLLVLFLANTHRVIHRKELIDKVWGEWYGDYHVLEVHVSRLRKKILDAGGPRLAQAVRGIGYRSGLTR